MSPESYDDYDLHEQLDRLSAATADRDVLVTLAVPPTASIGEARQPVETDYAEATQLNQRSFPKPLVDALESVRRELNEYDGIPENGLVIDDTIYKRYRRMPWGLDPGVESDRQRYKPLHRHVTTQQTAMEYTPLPRLPDTRGSGATGTSH